MEENNTKKYSEMDVKELMVSLYDGLNSKDTHEYSSDEITELYNGGAGFQYPFTTTTTGASFLLTMI